MLEETSLRLVFPIMPYGAEIWVLTTPAKNNLAAAQTKMKRSMLNMTHRYRIKTITSVRETTKVTDMIEQVRRKWT